MDLRGEYSAPAVEFSEVNESPQHTVPHVDANEIKDNHVDDRKSMDDGPCSNDNQTQRLSADQGVGSGDFTADNHVNGPAGIVLPMHSSPPPATSTPKGYGLKKWRRIKRDIVKDPTAVIDGSKVLKRGLFGSENPTKPQHMASTEIMQNIGPHIRPVNTSRNTNVASGSMMHSPRSDTTENSEDRSSKSSTAASMPEVLPTVLGYVHRRNHMKNFSGKTEGNSSPTVQQGKGNVENSKKPRAESDKIEKESSPCSIRSDSRSSNFGFMPSNGKQSGNSLDLNGKNVDEAHEGESQINEEVQAAYRKEKSEEIEELSPDDLAADLSQEAKEEKSENHRISLNQDPLANSILSLQSVQEALESEIHKLKEIGKEPTSPDDGSVNMESIRADFTFADQETSSSDRLNSDKISSTSGSLETQIFTLTHKVKYLESQLEEARAVLRGRESKISKLETSVNGSRSRKEDPGSTAEMQQDKHREMESDLEGIFQQRMEAEIEFLALTRALQKSSVSVFNRQTAVFNEQKSLAGKQAHLLNKLVGEEFEKYNGGALGADNVSKIQRRVCKVTLCFFTQLVLLVFVFLFVFLQLTPYSGVVVPT
ncbi:Arabidopsis thaliana WPP domain interacting protein 1, WPP domain interacting protein 1 [Hibiscus trionum]|uniref:Arabidopsis thaliana WPP domain interacting protein 1, WPP domain interacting protein 1 n=1 Tax=Hibiscus trionum TaxID=183268 RepID=A0A9W7GUS8_HIBTR|nr:Arabidopsis thaliana WPP domain interacting protein 1, WPP domain interacting protein 1 [Hibiscus trionum]